MKTPICVGPDFVKNRLVNIASHPFQYLARKKCEETHTRGNLVPFTVSLLRWWNLHVFYGYNESV